jgi:molybdopterin/thiamine biosynthesis adenylyltransferase
MMEAEELERYARHIVLREIGGAGQQKLRKARVLVIGAGGLGSPVLMYLAAAGVGVLGVVDDDIVSLSNLQRQVLHATESVGVPKVTSAVEAVARINPHVTIEPHQIRITAENAGNIIANYDLVMDGSDNFDTRYLINEVCVGLKKPLISAAMSQWEGQISLYDPTNGGPCYACVFPERPADGLAPSCAEAGVMGALAGVMGSMMAGEAIKFISGAGEGLRGQMLIFDALYGETRKFKLAANVDCPVCGHLS